MALVIFVLACGGETETPRPPPAPGDLGTYGFEEWEFYPTGGDRHQLVLGRVVDPDGSPVPGARATVMINSLLAVLPPKPGASGTTDQDGVFRIRGVPTRVSVLVEKAGWGGRLVPVYELLPTLEEPREVMLRPTAVLSGVVRFPDGRPVANYPMLASTPGSDWLRIFETDAGGAYRVVDVPVGTVQVAVVLGRVVGEPVTIECDEGEEIRADLIVREIPPIEGLILDRDTEKPVPGAAIRSVSDKEVVVFADGEGRFRLEGVHFPAIFVAADGYAEEPVGVDPGRKEVERLTVKLRRGARVYGRVVDSSGAPVAGARIESMNPDEEGTRSRGPLTGIDGRFEYTWVTLPEEGGRVALLAVGEHSPAMCSEVLEMRPGETVEDIEIVLPRSASVSFRIVDDEGSPVHPAWVTLGGRPTELPAGLASATHSTVAGANQADGAIRLRGLRGGPHQLGIFVPDRTPFEAKDVLLRAGEDQTLPDVVVPRGLTIAGRVDSDLDEIPPFSNVFVTDAADIARTPVEVKDDGSFRVFGLVDKEYILHFSVRGFEDVTLRGVKAGTLDLEVLLRALAEVRVSVARPAGAENVTFRIEVERVQEDHRVPDVRTRDLPPDLEDALFDGLRPGTFFVRAVSEEWFGMAEVELTPKERRPIELEVLAAASIKATVYMPDGRFAVSAGVELDAGKTWVRRGGRTDDRGVVRFKGVPVGEATLRCHPSGHPPLERVVTLRPGEETEVELRLTRGATLDVVVSDADGSPLPGVTVSFFLEDGEEARYWVIGRERAITGPEGDIRFAGVPAGRYVLTFWLEGDRMQRQLVVLGVDEPKKLAVKIDR